MVTALEGRVRVMVYDDATIISSGRSNVRFIWYQCPRPNGLLVGVVVGDVGC